VMEVEFGPVDEGQGMQVIRIERDGRTVNANLRKVVAENTVVVTLVLGFHNTIGLR
jgi:hypothetical protein